MRLNKIGIARGESELHLRTQLSELFGKSKDVSCLYTIGRKPAFLHLQSIEDGLRGIVGFEGKRFHIGDPYNPALFVNEGDAQWNMSVFHPEPVIVFFFKDEEHPFILPQLFSVHQPLCPLFEGLRHLHPDLFILEVERDLEEDSGDRPPKSALRLRSGQTARAYSGMTLSTFCTQASRIVLGVANGSQKQE